MKSYGWLSKRRKDIEKDFQPHKFHPLQRELEERRHFEISAN